MIIKGIALTALVASTPLALFATQNPKPVGVEVQATERTTNQEAEARRIAAEAQRSHDDLRRARAELSAAQKDLVRLRGQLEAALDRVDSHVTPKRERNCSPSRNRAMMSHYQWLRDQGHDKRASGALAKIVDQVGQDTGRLNSVAWDLMTNKETAGKFDELALALTQRMEAINSTDKRRRRIDHNHLDTAALANFLNGNVEKAIKLQKQAISKSSSSDFRRRLRTYEAARTALTKVQRSVSLPTATMIAANNEDEE